MTEEKRSKVLSAIIFTSLTIGMSIVFGTIVWKYFEILLEVKRENAQGMGALAASMLTIYPMLRLMREDITK